MGGGCCCMGGGCCCMSGGCCCMGGGCIRVALLVWTVDAVELVELVLEGRCCG
jgi:hypothetical protein